jgi:hypothetical protein
MLKSEVSKDVLLFYLIKLLGKNDPLFNNEYKLRRKEAKFGEMATQYFFISFFIA